MTVHIEVKCPLAAPTQIPIQSNRNQHSGPLGIMHNRALRTTEAAVIYPDRAGRKDRYIFQPPTYHEAGALHYMIWCPACAEWQRRGAFSDDPTRSTGKRGYCKTCESAQATARYHRRKLARAS
jgi:hypothetical protein